jgi:hypothetical protein
VYAVLQLLLIKTKLSTLKNTRALAENGASTAGRKSKLKSQKSKQRQYKLFRDLEWLSYLRRSVLVSA